MSTLPDIMIFSPKERERIKARLRTKGLADDRERLIRKEVANKMMNRVRLPIHKIIIERVGDNDYQATCNCGYEYTCNEITKRRCTAMINSIQGHITSVVKFREDHGYNNDSEQTLITLEDHHLAFTLGDFFSIRRKY